MIDGVTRYFAFTVLVFGLASAPFIFTKVVKVLIKHWRSNGILIFSRHRVSDMVKEDLFKSGFVVSELKSFWEPRQKGEHLGFIVDLVKVYFLLLRKEFRSLRFCLKHLWKQISQQLDLLLKLWVPLFLRVWV